MNKPETETSRWMLALHREREKAKGRRRERGVDKNGRQGTDRQATNKDNGTARRRERRKEQTVVGGKNPRGCWGRGEDLRKRERRGFGKRRTGEGARALRVSPCSRLDGDPIDGCARHATPGLDPRLGLRGGVSRCRSSRAPS
ncbi:hypothetical protein MRX96_011954 [Rhipicephalus microplus]